MNKLWLIETAWKLGGANCLRVAAYKVRVRLGIYRRRMRVLPLPTVGDALLGARPGRWTYPPRDLESLLLKAEELLAGQLEYFGEHWRNIGNPPDWFHDPWTQRRWSSGSHWSQTDEFGCAGVDVKVVWEPSRFEWAVLLARAYAASSKTIFLHAFCTWMDSWIKENPVNSGPNWKCGQETAIRLLRFLEALECLVWSPHASKAIDAFVVAHLVRIAATMQYAIGQDNNHGTTETAALFVAGQWLSKRSLDREACEFGTRMACIGKRRLLERVRRLVSDDGTFSQYSVNYHRMFLDTMSIAEAWSRRLGVPSPLMDGTQQIQSACDWLFAMVEPATGDAPNVGANDGALLLISPSTHFRDHRPTLQLASCLFNSERAYPQGPWDEACRYWDVDPASFAQRTAQRQSTVFRLGGFVTLMGGDSQSWALLRVPSFRFRPSQSDALHVDLWVEGENVVRDTGSYSYNSQPPIYNYFAGVQGHSTCQFDDHDQMPRLGRFLFARWLECAAPLRVDLEKEAAKVLAEYVDYTGCRHRRELRAQGDQWVICDDVAGFSERAVIRWHLMPDEWAQLPRGAVGTRIRLDVEGTADFEVRLVDGWESRTYLHKVAAPVLEIIVGPPGGMLRTTISIVR
jgi:hypothetical protein